MRLPLLAVFLSTLLVASYCSQPRCKPQGILALNKPYPAAQYGQVPYCDQYTCSCCNRTHGLTLYKANYLDESEDFNEECRHYLRLFACAVCDPEVGVGLKTAACPATCTAWYAACRSHFFGYDPHTQHLVPCTEHRAAQGLHICSRLEDLVLDGAALCKTTGFDVTTSRSTPCFDGSPPADKLPFCKHATSTPSRTPRRARRSHARTTPGGMQLDTQTWFVLVGLVSLALFKVLPKLMEMYQRSVQMRQQEQLQQQEADRHEILRGRLLEARTRQQQQLSQRAAAQ